MNNNLIDNTEFNISSYLNKNDLTPSMDQKKANAEKWAIDANAFIITPTEDLSDLEDQWIQFNSMIKKKRRESDWKSIELYGCTNQEHYDTLRSKMLKADCKDLYDELDTITPNSISESSYMDNSDAYYSTDSINYTSADVDKAREWSKESDRIIIIPTRNLQELEELWDSYNNMIKKHRRESDWMSTELFGVTNLQHYEYLKNQFLKDDIREEDKETYGSVIESVNISQMKRYYLKSINESFTDTVKSLAESLVQNDGPYDSVITSNIVSDVMDKYDSDIIEPSDFVDNIACGDVPYIDPDEMIDMGVFGQAPVDNYYGVVSDNSMLTDDISVREWFEIYRYHDKGLYTEFSNYTSAWVNKVRSLINEMNIMKDSWDEKKLLARKQSILELGWDPDVEFSPKARMIAREMGVMRMKSNFSGNSFKIVDLREFKSMESDDNILNESFSILKPIYIILIEGKSIGSAIIKKFTKGPYSHAAISLDPDLHNMYSYGVEINEHSDRKGFRREDIVDLPDGGKIGVFAIFVSNPVYEKISSFINKFKENAEKTFYSSLNILTYAFRIPYNTEWKLICSQFVDRCLQAVGINITGKDSSQVAPADMERALRENNKVYNLFEGIHDKYNPKKIKKLISSLSKKASPIKEAYSEYYLDENKYIAGVLGNINNVDALLEMKNHIDIVTNKDIRKLFENTIFDAVSIEPLGEAKEFPIQFDKEGNLLIKNLKKIDYEAEYTKSHKLLKQYDKSKNYEGMKYELSKLWMMMCMIEDITHSKDYKSKSSMELSNMSCNKAKAKISNDFQYYLQKVMKENPDFNFTEYYDASPFSSAATKINASTLTTMGKLIKQFIKSI